MSTAPLKQIVTVLNPEGLHLRPADLLVRAANQFTSSILIGKNAEMVDCKSILSLITLGADQGTELTIQADGADAADALQCLAALFQSRFAVVDSSAGDPIAVEDANADEGTNADLGNGTVPGNGTTQGQTL